MSETRDLYMSRKQQVIYYSGARDQRVLAARRFGKTDGVIGPHCIRVTQSMPQGAGAWMGNSKTQLFTKTVPATIAAIERWGLKEGVHFVWGRPNDKLGFQRPIVKPKEWSNVISFYNGFVWYLASLEVKGAVNSQTLNFLFLDEARFCKKSKIDGEVMPALSGITHPLGDPRFSSANPWYKGTMFVSDAALSIKDNWLEKEEEKSQVPIEYGPFKGKLPRDLQTELERYAEKVIYFNELFRRAKKAGRKVMVVSAEKRDEIRLIAQACDTRQGAFRILSVPGVNKQTVDRLVNYHIISADDGELLFNHEYLITPEEHFEMEAIRKSKTYQKRINDLRCNTFAFYRANSLDNIDLLGADYIARMKRDLPPVVYAVSILNLKKKASSDGFYSNLNVEEIHGYVPFECPAVEDAMHLKIASTVVGGQRIDTDYMTPDFAELQKVKTCRLDGDCLDEHPLYIAFDYNANINWVVTGQLYQSEYCGREALHTLSSMFVKNDRKLRELCQDWCRYYEPHKAKNRHVTYFYDATAKQRGYAISGQQDFKDVVIEELTKAGWLVNAVDMGRPMSHEMKHKDINEALAGVGYPFPMFNKENNEALIVAMENTAIKLGYDGFKKDKTHEKAPESELGDSSGYGPAEFRTDGTDAWDSLFLGVKYFRLQMDGVCMPMRWRR